MLRNSSYILFKYLFNTAHFTGTSIISKDVSFKPFPIELNETSTFKIYNLDRDEKNCKQF